MGDHQNIQPPPHPSFKPKLDKDARRKLHWINEQNPNAPLHEMRGDLNLNVSKRTKDGILHHMNFYIHVIYGKPVLNYE